MNNARINPDDRKSVQAAIKDAAKIADWNAVQAFALIGLYAELVKHNRREEIKQRPHHGERETR